MPSIFYILLEFFKFFWRTSSDNIFNKIQLTINNYFVQIKSDVLGEVIYCPPEKAVLLASYATQVKDVLLTSNTTQVKAVLLASYATQVKADLL